MKTVITNTYCNKFFLSRIYQKPVRVFSAQSAGAVFVFLYSLTYMVALGIYYYMYAIVNHFACGPAGSTDKTINERLIQLIELQPILALIFKHIINNSYLQYVIIVMVVAATLYGRFGVQALETQVHYLQERNLMDQEFYENKLQRMSAKLKALKKE